MTKDISLLICGDICSTSDTRAMFDRQDPEVLFGQLSRLIKAADFSIANLEYALTCEAQSAEKIGPVLSGPPNDAAFLAASGFDLLSLANNHISDCGPEGVLDTIAAIELAGVLSTGAGRTAVEAKQPVILETKGWRIGVIAVAEHEFNAAGQGTAGAHIFDPFTDLERIRTLKAKTDYVVVLYHGGIEYHSYPSPGLARTCRSLVRHGADLVLCQHSHVIGTFEAYKGGHIIYGQGNCVYGYRKGKPTWNEGLAIEVTLSRGNGITAQITSHPIGCDSSGKVDLLSAASAVECLTAMEQRSKQLENPGQIETEWHTFCARLSANHLPHVLGLGLWLTRLNRVSGGRLVRLLYGRRNRMTAMNVVRCDAHREVVLTAFAQSLKQGVTDKRPD